MTLEELAYKVWRIFEDAEIYSTPDGNMRYAQMVWDYFHDTDPDKEKNEDFEDLFGEYFTNKT